MHVPGIACWPGTIPSGSVSGEMASTLDLFPSLLRLSGAGQAYPVDGEDISGRFQTEPMEEGHRPFFYYGLNNRLFAVRKGPWKLHIERYSQTGNRYFAQEAPILFNLDEDPSEQYELSREYPDTVQQLLDLITEHQARMEAEPSFFDR
jgi:arylsulfatase